MRALAADTAGDGISGWGQHAYAAGQVAKVAHALVDALAVESDDVARESVLNTLCEFVAWDLAPAAAVSRALSLPRSLADGLGDYWRHLGAGRGDRVLSRDPPLAAGCPALSGHSGCPFVDRQGLRAGIQVSRSAAARLGSETTDSSNRRHSSAEYASAAISSVEPASA